MSAPGTREYLVPLSERESVHLTVKPTRSAHIVVRVGLLLRRGDGRECATEVLSLEPKDLRPLARALEDLAATFDHDPAAALRGSGSFGR